MQILIDESIKQIDQVCTRYAYGHVQINQQTIDDFDRWAKENVLQDNLRFDMKAKLHFTSLSTSQKSFLVEKISKLPISFKVYVSYVNSIAESGDDTKYNLLKRSILHHSTLQPKSSFGIEKAEEYRHLVRDLPQVQATLLEAKGNTSLLVADVLLGVYCGFLDIRERNRSSDQLLWHQLIYNQIRLEVIEFSAHKPLYLARANKLQ